MQVKYKSEKKCCVKAICNKKYNCCCLKFFISETLVVAFWGFCDLNWTHSNSCQIVRRWEGSIQTLTNALWGFFSRKQLTFQTFWVIFYSRLNNYLLFAKRWKKAEKMKKQKQLRILHLPSFVVIFTKVNIYFASFFLRFKFT